MNCYERTAPYRMLKCYYVLSRGNHNNIVECIQNTISGSVSMRARLRLACSGSRDQPLQNGIKIDVLLRTDSVAADFSMRHSLQFQPVNKFVYRHLLLQIGLVA